ncbi:MAG: 6-bladed beta-propeller [Candidatus Aegiribacteria sp.]|nr:6-bladed beta-propeller [Candidatus Aegiribacteria sp.]
MRIYCVFFIGCIFLILILGCGEENAVFPDDQITLPVDTLRVVFEIGQEIGDSSNTFSSLKAALIDKQNRIIVLDEVEACIKVFDIQGTYIRQISRRGSGPGELSHPVGLFLMPDGRLGVNAAGKGGYVVFDDSLNFLEEISLWRGNSPYSVTPASDSRLVACKYDIIMRDNNIVMSRSVGIYSWGESECDTLLWKDSIVTTQEELYENLSMVALYALIDRLDTGGSVEFGIYFAPVDPYEYRVIGWDSTGAEILSITRDMTPVAKTPEEIANERVYVNWSLDRGSGGSSGVDYQPAPYRNMIAGVDIGPDENLWVRRGTRLEPFFDIFDLNGNLLRHAVYPIEGWGWETEVTAHGILAWELDPFEGYQKLYLLE